MLFRVCVIVLCLGCYVVLVTMKAPQHYAMREGCRLESILSLNYSAAYMLQGHAGGNLPECELGPLDLCMGPNAARLQSNRMRTRPTPASGGHECCPVAIYLNTNQADSSLG